MDEHIEFEQANRRAKKRLLTTPHAVSARYDRRTGRVVIRLTSNVEISFPSRDAQGLETATAEQLQTIEISPSGFGIHIPALDADLYIPALLDGILGSKRWMAARLGKEGGQARSTAKAQASRKNGRLGGRPKKAATAA